MNNKTTKTYNGRLIMKNVRAPLTALVVLAVVGAIWAVAIAGDIRQDRLTLAHVIDQTGDSANILKLNVLSALDSFTYVDSIWFETDTTIVTWTSHPTTRRLVLTLDTTETYCCSVDCGTNIYGFEFVCPNGATYDADSLADDLVDSFTNVAGMKDTVLAEDSSSYLKIVSKIAQIDLEGDARWTLKVDPVAEIAEADSTFTTKAMLCDSLAAAFNGEATLADMLVAANSGDTVITLTGRSGWKVNIFVGDTAQTATETQAEKASKSRFADTFPIFPMLTDGFNTLQGTVILRASGYTGAGYGLSDSGMVKLMSRVGPYDGTPTGGTWTLIDSDTSAGLPTTLTVAVEDSATYFGEMLYLVVSVIDTATDTAVTANHDIDYWFMRVED